MKAKYGLYDYTKGGTWMLMWTVDKNSKPLMTMAQALEALKDFPERPEMRVGTV